MHNDHVLKWIRWQHFLAVRHCRQLAQLYWATQFKLDGGESDDT